MSDLQDLTQPLTGFSTSIFCMCDDEMCIMDGEELKNSDLTNIKVLSYNFKFKKPEWKNITSVKKFQSDSIVELSSNKFKPYYYNNDKSNSILVNKYNRSTLIYNELKSQYQYADTEFLKKAKKIGVVKMNDSLSSILRDSDSTYTKNDGFMLGGWLLSKPSISFENKIVVANEKIANFMKDALLSKYETVTIVEKSKKYFTIDFSDPIDHDGKYNIDNEYDFFENFNICGLKELRIDIIRNDDFIRGLLYYIFQKSFLTYDENYDRYFMQFYVPEDIGELLSKILQMKFGIKCVVKNDIGENEETRHYISIRLNDEIHKLLEEANLYFPCDFFEEIDDHLAECDDDNNIEKLIFNPLIKKQDTNEIINNKYINVEDAYSEEDQLYSLKGIGLSNVLTTSLIYIGC